VSSRVLREAVLSANALMLASMIWDRYAEDDNITGLSNDLEACLNDEETTTLLEVLLWDFAKLFGVEDLLSFFDFDDIITPDQIEYILYKDVLSALRYLLVRNSAIRIIDRTRIVLERWLKYGKKDMEYAYDNDGRKHRLSQLEKDYIDKISLMIVEKV